MNRKRLSIISSPLILILFACGSEEEPTNGGGGATHTACGPLTTLIGSSPRLVFAYPENDTFGVNAFYIWEVDADAEDEGHVFQNGSPVLDRVPIENWVIQPTIWSAARLALDGLDPYVFTEEDPFVHGYLPYTPGTAWRTREGTFNNGTCPDSNTQVGELWSCIDQKQLDPDAPALLTVGKQYLLQMSMIIPLGEGKNRVGSCFRDVIMY